MNQDPTEHLTQAELAELKAAFARVDTDGDGAITAHELGSALRTLGHNPTLAELQDLINLFDTDNNGNIDFPEFVAVAASREREMDPSDELWEAFRIFDRDDDGFITKTELQEAMLGLGERLTEADVAERIRHADADGDGRIDYDEFVEMMTL